MIADQFNFHSYLSHSLSALICFCCPEYVTVITDFKVSSGGGTNVLGIVVFSVVLGIILGTLEEKGRALKECVDSLMYAIIGMVKLIIWYGHFFLDNNVHILCCYNLTKPMLKSLCCYFCCDYAALICMKVNSMCENRLDH